MEQGKEVKTVAPTKKELYEEIEVLKTELEAEKTKTKELEEYANNAQNYIDKLYDNSNTMNIKLDTVKHHVSSLDKTAKVIEEMFNLFKERMNYVHAVLETNAEQIKKKGNN